MPPIVKAMGGRELILEQSKVYCVYVYINERGEREKQRKRDRERENKYMHICLIKSHAFQTMHILHVKCITLSLYLINNGQLGSS